MPLSQNTEERLRVALADRYTIEGEIGSGGMATVYLAQDLKHDRAVALKVLKPELAALMGGERFLTEIKTTANLQHPHILPLFDSGEADGFLYYVMPYVKGESLREKLDREKQLSIEESVEIAKSVASALDYAHRQNVIHRDIKPENILLHDGQPVVADFGIALAVSAAGGSRLTETGLSIGTPQYMSPEQATGDREVDGRGDVYSLACVLYEMLAGDPPHIGSTVQAVIAKVITDHPRPVTELRDSVPRHTSAAVHKGLAKVPADRFATAKVFAAALSDSSFTDPTTGASLAPSGEKDSRTGPWLQRGAVLALAFIAAILAWVLKPLPESSSRPVQFSIMSDSTHQIGGGFPAISPDGSVVVFRGEIDGQSMLFQHRLSELASSSILGTKGGEMPFFSPDGQWLGFWRDRSMLKTRLDGNMPETIFDDFASGYATWGSGDRIVFSSRPAGRVYQVSATSGSPEPFFPLDTLRPDIEPSLPSFIPGRDAILFTDVHSGISLSVLDLQSGEIRSLGPGSRAKYIKSGHLVFSQVGDGSLMLQPFDLAKLDTVGQASRTDWNAGMGHQYVPRFDVSSDGALVVLRVQYDDQMVLQDPPDSARTLPNVSPPWVPRYSPNGSRIAYGAIAAGQDRYDLWVYNSNSGTPKRLTQDAVDANDPVWSPAGDSLVFSAGLQKDLYMMSSEGGGEARLLLRRAGDQWPSDWSPDGRYIVFTDFSAETNSSDIYTLDLEPDSPPQPFLATGSSEKAGVVSPNGRWLAYQSDETEQFEIWVESFPETGQKEGVSTGGGIHPVWWSPRDDPELAYLYYWNEDQVFRVQVTENDGFVFGPRETVLATQDYPGGPHPAYDIHPEGHEFVYVAARRVRGRLIVALDMLGKGG